MAHDEPTEANRVPWLPGISRYAYRFVSGGYENHARRQVTFDDQDAIIDAIIDVITSAVDPLVGCLSTSSPATEFAAGDRPVWWCG